MSILDQLPVPQFQTPWTAHKIPEDEISLPFSFACSLYSPVIVSHLTFADNVVPFCNWMRLSPMLYLMHGSANCVIIPPILSFFLLSKMTCFMKRMVAILWAVKKIQGLIINRSFEPAIFSKLNEVFRNERFRISFGKFFNMNFCLSQQAGPRHQNV